MEVISTITVEYGQEDNLYLYPCARCQEPMYHLCELVGDYPLWREWALCCGECGALVVEWEVVPVDWTRWARQLEE